MSLSNSALETVMKIRPGTSRELWAIFGSVDLRKNKFRYVQNSRHDDICNWRWWQPKLSFTGEHTKRGNLWLATLCSYFSTWSPVPKTVFYVISFFCSVLATLEDMQVAGLFWCTWSAKQWHLVSKMISHTATLTVYHHSGVFVPSKQGQLFFAVWREGRVPVLLLSGMLRFPHDQ